MPLSDRITLTESGFLFDHSSGVTYTLNGTGTAIMQMLLESKESDDIIAELMKRFEVEERDARFDLDQFVSQIRKFSLI